MVAAVVKASPVGAWAGSLSLSTPSCRTSRCSTWVSQLNPGFARSRVDNVARQRQSLAFSGPGLSGSFRGGRVDWKVESPERRFRTGLVRVSASQDDASGSGADALEGIDLDPGVFKEQSFQKVKAQYAEPVNPDDFKDAHDLMAAYEGQKVLGKLVHERMELKELKAKGGPVQLWNWMKSAQGMLGAVALTVVMLMHMPGPPKPPVVRDVLPHRRSINAAAPRRGRGAALRGTPRSEHVSPVEFLPQAIAACSVIAMVTHLLQKNACEQTPMLVQKEPKTDTGMTVFHLHLGISGFACSLRYDLDDINGNELDVLGRVERPQSLKTIARVLSRHLEHIVYAGNQIQHTMHPTTWPTFLNNWEYADASHIRLAPTKETLKKIGKDYGRPMKEDDRMLMDSYKAGYTAVTLSGAVRGRLPLPPVTNSLNLHVLLASLEVLDPARVETLKLSWTPTTGETLPEETMLAYFPHMTLLAEPVEVL